MTAKNAELLREVKPVAYSIWMPMSGAMRFTTDDRVLVSNRADYVVEKLYSEATVLKMLDRIRALATAPQDATSKAEVALNVKHRDCHKAADAFWQYWRENGVPHKHGYYESTWGAMNQAPRYVGVVPHEYKKPSLS